jgi:hypothetical protein
MECNFQVGDQVVAVPINGHGWSHYAEKYKINVPYPKCIYTVREVYLCDMTKNIGIYLVEVVNAPMTLRDGSIREVGWAAKDFQPVTKKDTDISIFKKLERPKKLEFLTKEPERVKEKV